MRSAPPAYSQEDQQEVRNVIDGLARNTNKPVDKILMQDISNGKLYFVQVNAGVLEAVLV